MAVVQKHALSPLDKARRALGWMLFILAAPVVLLAALFVFLQIFMLAINLIGNWISS